KSRPLRGPRRPAREDASRPFRYLRVVRESFVDCHSHVVPSGDDGAQNLQDGIDLCELAARAGTKILYATPHVWPHLVLTEQRERAIRADFQELRAGTTLELRLGFELTPAPPLLAEDPARYALE